MRPIDPILERERGRIGQSLGPTRWRTVVQDDISTFGACTHDPDPMHVDPEWARRLSPFGGTIAFGFWTLSMITAFQHEMAGGADGGRYEGAADGDMIGVNYGCDRLRFIEPVRVGARIRAHGSIVSVEALGPDRLLRKTDLTVEIEGVGRPALSTRWLSMLLLTDPTARLEGFRRETTQ